ncbi:hypothetical protein, partial [Plasmodium yoelii yoelii]
MKHIIVQRVYYILIHFKNKVEMFI